MWTRTPPTLHYCSKTRRRVSFFLYICNRSLLERYISPSQKRVIVLPAPKKPNLDPTLCQNYRPISSLSFLSKTLERFISIQLLPYFEIYGLHPAHQSRFRTNHST